MPKIEPEKMKMQNGLYLLEIIKSPPSYGSIMIPPEARKNESYAKVVASPDDHLLGKLVIYEPEKGRSPDGDIFTPGRYLLVEKENLLAVIEP